MWGCVVIIGDADKVPLNRGIVLTQASLEE